MATDLDLDLELEDELTREEWIASKEHRENAIKYGCGDVLREVWGEVESGHFDTEHGYKMSVLNKWELLNGIREAAQNWLQGIAFDDGVKDVLNYVDDPESLLEELQCAGLIDDDFQLGDAT